MSGAGALRFTATLRKVGVNLLVDVPARITQHFGKRGYVPVQATLQGKPFAQTLVPAGDGRHVLYVNVPMLKAAGVSNAGEKVTITLVADPASRAPPMHDALAKALRKDPAANAAFESLNASRRKEVLRYLHHLKSEAAVARNVERFVASLRQGPDDLPMGM